ncbi:HD domain-containing protein [Rhizobium ruizarguesonis]|uniref:HD domain-containing protein n=1 Tax=Rhizobium ruizarguesonis TaxID=2081791 RepID=UPI001FF04F5F|nr:HD domain-containing protein [Rhizobium ruizarguesonis]
MTQLVHDFLTFLVLFPDPARNYIQRAIRRNPMNFRTIIAATCTTLSVLAGLTGPPKDGQADPLVAEADINTSKPAADIPDTELTRDATRLVREAEGDFLFEHSVRVYQWAALAGRRKGVPFDPEQLYVAALFHDFGLTDRYGQSHLRFEVDGANAARDFLRGHGVPEVSRENICLAIALHTTNGISANLSPTAALVAEGANMDLVGAGYDNFTTAERNAVETAHPHPPGFADGFMDILYKSLGHRPETTQGTGLADVMAYKDPAFRRRDFSNLMRNSKWAVGD